MARTDPQVNIRLPADLKDRLDEQARASGRSLTAEIVYRLEASLKGIEAAKESLGVAKDAMLSLDESLALNQELQRRLEMQNETTRRAFEYFEATHSEMQELEKKLLRRLAKKSGKPESS